MRLKKIIGLVHLWVGLIAGLIVSIVGLSGAIYVFAPEIEAYPYNRQVMTSAALPLITPAEIISRYELVYGKRLTLFMNRRRAEKFYIIRLKDPARKIIVNPYTGKELSSTESDPATFWSWLMDIHMNLGLGTVGKYISGIASLLLAMVIISTGICLWWPKNKKALRQALSIRWNASWKRKNYDIHNAGGWYTHLFIGLLAFTGACFTFPDLGPGLLNAISFQTVPSREAAPLPTLSGGDRKISFTRVAEIAAQLYPDYYLMHIVYDRESPSPVVITKTNHQWISPGKYIRIYSYLDPYTGEVLRQYDPRTASWGEKITEYYKRQIHYGEIGGWPTRVLAFFAGMFIPVLYITGILIWYNRKWGKKAQKRARPTAR